MRINWPFVVVAVLLAIGLTAFLVFYESYIESSWVGYQGPARTQPFLAAQRFLEKNNVAVTADPSSLDFTELSHDSTIFISSLDSVVVSAEHVDQSLSWVAQGGYLIAGVGQESQGAYSLLHTFDVTPEIADWGGAGSWLLGDTDKQRPPSEVLRKLNEEIKKKNEAREKQGKGTLESVDALEELFGLETKEYEISLYDGNQVRMEVLDNIVLNHPSLNERYDEDEYDSVNEDEDRTAGKDVAEVNDGTENGYQIAASASDDVGTRLIQFEYGDGVVTLLSSDKLWRNQHVDKADHAYFLDYLVPAGSSALIFYNVDMPGLWVLVNRHFQEVLIAVALFIGLWLWQKSVRTKPIQEPKVDAHRDFYEHLTAGANFLLRHQEYSVLTKPLKEDVWQAMQSRRPEFAGVAYERQLLMLANEVETSQESISNWLKLIEKCNSEEEFNTVVKTSNWIRKKL